MEFEGQYLTYQEYVDLGGTLEETPFNLLEYEARKEIDERTQGRLIDKGNEYQDVKLCVYKLIEKINSYKMSDSRDKSISSESIDGYTINYGSETEDTIKAKKIELEDVIDTYLSNLKVDGIRVIWRGYDS